MTAPNDFNQKIIDEFRANAGKVGPPFAGANVLLLTSTGAKTGRRLTTPLVYMPDGERMIIFASKAGAPNNPGWYHNLLAHPDTTVEVGNETVAVRAVEIKGAERDRIYAQQAARAAAFAEYQAKTTRRIPVVALERRAG